MYENHHENFGRRRFDDERNSREQRWRRGEDPYRREAIGHSYDEDRYDDRSRGHDDDYGGNGWYSTEQSGYGRGSNWANERPSGRGYRTRGQQHADHEYGGRAGYDRPGDSRYFTGQQGSWAVRSPYGSSAYASNGFGEDYREHGYDRERHGDDRGFFEKAGDEIASWFGDEDAARRREQDHRGRGPRNYVRSDERIRDDANDVLTDDWRLDASEITVRVESGEVTLDGTVPNRDSKRRAEDLIEDISGVKHVQNNLRVAQTDFAAQNRASSDAGSMISGSASQPGMTTSASTGASATGQNTTTKSSEQV